MRCGEEESEDMGMEGEVYLGEDKRQENVIRKCCMKNNKKNLTKEEMLVCAYKMSERRQKP